MTSVKTSPPRRSSGPVPSPRTESYPPERPDTSTSGEESPPDRSAETLQARILACIAGTGPVRFTSLHERPELTDLTSTEFVESLWALVDSRRVDADGRSEIVVIDGIRQPRFFTLLSVAKKGGA